MARVRRGGGRLRFYESVWDLLISLALVWVARLFADRLKNGDVFMLYVSLYSVGRFFVEPCASTRPSS